MEGNGAFHFLYIKIRSKMARLEPKSILGSSQDNFIVFSNTNYEKPMVTFNFRNATGTGGTITVRDALDDDGYNKVIAYDPDKTITDSSFKWHVGDAAANSFAFVETLKKNPIFYDITLITEIPNVGMIIRASIDSSTRYSITSTNGVEIGGTYSSYVPKEPNKFVLMLSGQDRQLSLEKFTMAEDVSFNVTAPFQHLSFKDPFQLKMLSYHVDNNAIYQDAITNNVVTVLPTTLSKFDDTDLTEYKYLYDWKKIDFLTRNFRRYYNYGEVCALSLLSENSNVSILKRYYTVSGKYIGQDTDVIHSERNVIRWDFYFECNIAAIEAQTNRQVGYVEVVGVYNGIEITNPVRYNVVPKCNQNNVIFFVNELGGIDSFNFLGEKTVEYGIDDQNTYFINNTRNFVGTREIEAVGQKRNEVSTTLKSAIIDSATATWLNELSKSKYAFLFVNEGSILYERIVVTEFDIDVSDRENTFELELTYQRGDANIRL